MPCGGIQPIKNGKGTIKKKLDPTQGGCWVCGRGGCKHFCLEWDTFIHARCVSHFLQSDEGRCVIEHKHEIYLRFDLEEAPKVSKEISQLGSLLNFGDIEHKIFALVFAYRDAKIAKDDRLANNLRIVLCSNLGIDLDCIEKELGLC